MAKHRKTPAKTTHKALELSSDAHAGCLEPNEAGFSGDNTPMTIGTLARQAGVTVRTLRYYEEMDLIAPARRSSGRYRLYAMQALKRVRAILALQSLGFSLEEVLAVLGPYSQSLAYTRIQQLDHTRTSLLYQKARVAEKLDQLTRLQADIEQRLALLETVCTPCTRVGEHQHCLSNCTYLEIHT